MKTVLNPDEAAEYLSVSRATIDRLRDAGKLKSFRIGKAVRIRVAVLDDYIERLERAELVSQEAVLRPKSIGQNHRT